MDRKIIGAILGIHLGLAGCVSNPVRDMPNLATASVGDVTAKLAEDIKPGRSSKDESENFHHWRHHFPYCRTCYTRGLLDGQLFGAYQPACEARQANFSYLPTRENPKFVECRSAAGELIFAVHAKVESGKALGTWFITADSFEAKRLSPTLKVWDEYAVGSDGLYKRDKEQERIDAAKRADEAKVQLDRYRKAAALAKVEMERQQRLDEEQRTRELPIVKTVGQKVCASGTGNERQVVAYAFGKPVFSDPVNREYRVTGFTEQVAGNRIRVLVAGIQIIEGRGNTRAIDKLEGDAVLERGKPTWDDARNWRLCH